MSLEHRIGIFDFVVIGKGLKNAVAYFPSAPKYDPRLFIRPFATKVWPLICAIPLLVMIWTFFDNRFASKISGNNQSRLWGTKLITSVGWMAHVLIIGYYDGALTMFFTDEITASFESELDILKSYPDWILNVRDGGQTHLHVKADAGNNYYQMYVELMKNFPSKMLYKNVVEGVNRMKSGQTAIYEEKKNLRQYYNNNPEEARPMIIPRHGDTYAVENFVFTENSPLVPYFTPVCLDLYSNGMIHILEEKWFGKELESKVSGNLHTVVLNLGQMMLIFSILGIATVVAVMALGIELIWYWMKNDRIRRSSMVGSTNQSNETNYEIDECDGDQEQEQRTRREIQEIPRLTPPQRRLTNQRLSIEDLE
jgi:hypothetical protein